MHYHSIRLDYVDVSRLLVFFLVLVFVGSKSDPGQSRGKPDASAEGQPRFV